MTKLMIIAEWHIQRVPLRMHYVQHGHRGIGGMMLSELLSKERRNGGRRYRGLEGEDMDFDFGGFDGELINNCDLSWHIDKSQTKGKGDELGKVP